jgi:hypothetical protein
MLILGQKTTFLVTNSIFLPYLAYILIKKAKFKNLTNMPREAMSWDCKNFKLKKISPKGQFWGPTDFY